MQSEFWPWWLGATALMLAPLLHLTLTGRALGVSGAWGRVANYRRERRAEELTQAMATDAAMEAALLAATQAEFGNAAVAPAPAAANQPSRANMPLPVASSLAFLAALMAGGALSSLLRGTWQLHTDMGATFSQMWSSQPAQVGVLALGGVLVGFGTRLAGGCTSGHGLMGCGRLQVPSILATAVFLGTAVAVSLALELVVHP